MNAGQACMSSSKIQNSFSSASLHHARRNASHSVVLLVILLSCVDLTLAGWSTRSTRTAFSFKRDYKYDTDVELVDTSQPPSSGSTLMAPLSTSAMPFIKTLNSKTTRVTNLHLGNAVNGTIDIVFFGQGEAKKSSKKSQKIPKWKHRPTVFSSNDLRRLILDEGKELKELRVDVAPQNFTYNALFDHKVVQLILQRAREGSKPGHRALNDTSTLALAIEGGGMRGAVCAGMAAALTCLGLNDSFDTIYGSSAGSVVGAFLVSRQICMDVYVDILPAAKSKFVCKKRLSASLGMTALDAMFAKLFKKSPTGRFSSGTQPGLNISFVLDEVMHPERGLRPFDIKTFLKNDRYQPLRIAATYDDNGRLVSQCFGREDFLSVKGPCDRSGVYACLHASMTVPGAAGPPVKITNAMNQTRSYVDAFCCEPLPYRSAVEEGATHCLVLCSRPDGFQPQTKPTVYELGIAPMYFRVHDEENLAKFFKKGGQQYLYAEDLLTLMEGQLDRGEGVPIPPTTIFYGVERDENAERLKTARESWKKAHILPIKAVAGTEELATLEQGRAPVVEAVRSGFAAVYDIFAPALSLDIGRGEDIAKIIFPDSDVSPPPVESTLPIFFKLRMKSAEIFKIFRDAERDSSRRVRHAVEERLYQVRMVLDSLPGLQSEAFAPFSEFVRRSHMLE
mmetsp:Transcript_3886/g.7769  ORF Transcript_3886/g.7769 Transcript_3886/m.7769 type:complete len:677 (-) Transcript_3886:701-2731(-)|eukprot:scaffold1595_cov171-Amphora_coffeaeformis.AAC.1